MTAQAEVKISTPHGTYYVGDDYGGRGCGPVNGTCDGDNIAVSWHPPRCPIENCICGGKTYQTRAEFKRKHASR